MCNNDSRYAYLRTTRHIVPTEYTRLYIYILYGVRVMCTQRVMITSKLRVIHILLIYLFRRRSRNTEEF